jgi:hypothetical protein
MHIFNRQRTSDYPVEFTGYFFARKILLGMLGGGQAITV